MKEQYTFTGPHEQTDGFIGIYVERDKERGGKTGSTQLLFLSHSVFTPPPPRLLSSLYTPQNPLSSHFLPLPSLHPPPRPVMDG